MNELHSLLKRQLRRFTGETKSFIEEQTDFLRAINEAYLQFDADRRMLEHSLELTSQELLEANTELSSRNTDLEMRVEARTAELSSSEARFRELFEHAPVSIWEEDFSALRQYIDDLRATGIVDFSAYFDAHPEAVAESAARVKIVDVNLATLEMYQAESKTQLLADLSKVLGPESLIPFKEELLALARGKTHFENENTNYTLRGERRAVFMRLTVAPGYAETWSKVFVGISDITERRQAEAALAVERDLLQALMDNIPDTIYFKDTASRFTRINRAQVSVLGVAAQEAAIGKSDLDFQDSELARSFYEEEQRIIDSGEPLINRIEFNPTPDGQPRWFSATKVPIKDPNGRVIGIVGVSRDITERKQVEDTLAAERDLLQALMDNIPDLIYFKDTSSRFTRINRAEAKLLGVETPEQAIGKTDLDFQDPDLAQSFYEEEQRLVETGEALINRIEFNPTPDGQPRWFSTTKVPIKDEAGSVISIVGITHDITERKQIEEALRQSEERFRLMAWATQDAVWDWDLQTNQIWWGEGLQKIFHYSSNTTPTNPEWRLDHIHPEDKAKVNRVIDQALEGGMEFWSKEYRFQRIDGTYTDIMDRGYIIRDDAGKAYRMIGAMMDITERKQAEETINHQNKMLSSLHQITLDLLRYREIDQLLNALIELSAKFLDAPYAEIMLVEGEMLVVKAATQSQPRSIGERVRRDGALLSWQAFDTHAPAVLSDYANWPNRQAIYDNFPLHAVADFPILNDDRCLGVLSLGRHEPDYEFNLDQIQFGRLFANLTALVLNNAQLREALREQSIRDPLTELYNRRYMEEALNQQLSRVTRQLLPLGLIMIDIDHFKNFNDTHGHAAGDALLRELGQFLKNHVRNEDIACRYGGEEFLLIMPDASLEAAHQRAVLLQQEAKKLRVQDAGQSLQGITLSLGVAIYPEHGRNMDSLLRAADAALYRAKQEGRDRVVVAERVD